MEIRFRFYSFYDPICPTTPRLIHRYQFVRVYDRFYQTLQDTYMTSCISNVLYQDPGWLIRYTLDIDGIRIKDFVRSADT